MPEKTCTSSPSSRLPSSRGVGRVEAAHFLTCQDLPGLTLTRSARSASAQPRHVHDSLVLGVVLTGARWFETPGGTVLVRAGQGFALAPGLAHACVPGENAGGGAGNAAGNAAGDAGGGEGFCSYFALSVAPPLLASVQLPPVLPVLLTDEALLQALALLAEAVEGAAEALERQSLLAECLELLAGAWAGGAGEVRDEMLNEAVCRAKGLLAEQLAQAVPGMDLNALALACGMAPYALHRAFTRVVGLPPHAYQTHLRLRRAKELLRAGAGLTEAALTSGFCDQSHMHRHFVRLVGLTPGQYARAFATRP